MRARRGARQRDARGRAYPGQCASYTVSHGLHRRRAFHVKRGHRATRRAPTFHVKPYTVGLHRKPSVWPRARLAYTVSHACPPSGNRTCPRYPRGVSNRYVAEYVDLSRTIDCLERVFYGRKLRNGSRTVAAKPGR
jgi:hypothetical protein